MLSASRNGGFKNLAASTQKQQRRKTMQVASVGAMFKGHTIEKRGRRDGMARKLEGPRRETTS